MSFKLNVCGNPASAKSIGTILSTFSHFVSVSQFGFVAVVQSINCVQFFATTQTVACLAPLSIGFSRQEYWSGLSLPPPGTLSNPGIELMSLGLLH